MSEQDEKLIFLKKSPAFSDLPDNALNRLLEHLSIAFNKAGTELNAESFREFALLRTGSAELQDVDGQFINRLGSGDAFFFRISDYACEWDKLVFLEDALVYFINGEIVSTLVSCSKTLEAFLSALSNQEQPHALSIETFAYDIHLPVSQLMASPPVSTTPNMSIKDAAKIMAERDVSSLLICDGNAALGILTDKDLRRRVVASGIDFNETVGKVMTPNPVSVDHEAHLFEAQSLMMEYNIHHLPVMDQQSLLGIVSLNDFARARNNDPLFMIQAINRAKKRDDIAKASKSVPELILKLIQANTTAHEIGKIITSITDNMTRKLIELAQSNLGKAPMQFAWIVFGSQARADQVLGSDQDNALIMEREPSDSENHYFEQFARYVNEGLDAAGLRFCPGGIMAMNKEWCLSQQAWRAHFKKWIQVPDSHALMHANIFYDLRHIAGKSTLTEELIEFINRTAQKNSLFFVHLANDLLSLTPPLGFFKQFVLEKDGHHNQVLDLKIRGTVPIVGVARFYALMHGISQVNTKERLCSLKENKHLSHSEVNNLIDAHEFIAKIRLERQARASLAGDEVSNHLDPKALSSLVRHQLKEAFTVVAASQKSIRQRVSHGLG